MTAEQIGKAGIRVFVMMYGGKKKEFFKACQIYGNDYIKQIIVGSPEASTNRKSGIFS